jgi:NADH-quinone oxidoreductase subunit F
MCKCDNCSTANKVENIQGLKNIREKLKATLAFRTRDISSKKVSPKDESGSSFEIALCLGTSCISSGADKVKSALIAELEKHGLTDRINIIETGCNGFCVAGPLMVIYPQGYLYIKVTSDDVPEIVSEHILNNRPVERLMYHDTVANKPIPLYNELPFFAPQDLRVLRNKAIISAENIEEYIGRDGYFGFARALTEMTPEQILDEVKNSGLRGRGGAGFLTGLKWQFCHNAAGDKKYILCNADEGDPGAFMDRSLLESDPHSVLEGMMIGALAIGAEEGCVYCRAEYPLALQRLECAIEDCRKYGLLGKNILGTEFCFDITISHGSGAFVCGEETALMRSIEGKRGEPRPRPPFPAVKGLWDKPTVLNNVETLGNIPLIIHNGADWFRTVGTKTSPGTKVFALAGAIKNAGLVEVPIGTALGDLIYEIGNGIPKGKKFKAAQLGGPSGGCVPITNLDVPLDYESLNELGAIMGSGGIVIMDENTCMVDVARFFLEFVQEESCGKCVPCREGTKRMLEVLDKICSGKGKLEDIDSLEELGQQISETALCGLGQTAPNPVLSTIRHFRQEYEDHILLKQCKAGICPELTRAPCQSACPANVDVPGFVSLTGEKRYDEAIKLHRERNPFASICARVCFHPCENNCRRETIDSSVEIRSIKRFMTEMEKSPQLPSVVVNEENAKKKVAVVGAGPAGLTCAYFLARMGYKPVVFEAEEKAGGMLVWTIPSYRLPREQVEREIGMIESLGVTIKTGSKLGKDFTLEDLKNEGFEAVFLGVGAPEGTVLKMKGSESKGVTDAISFLWDYNKNGKTEVGKKVVVIGGGNSAIDAARTALRLGADVTMVYRRTKEEMPAADFEIKDALEEGVKINPLTNPTEVISKDGKIVAVKCTVMELGEYDKSGRRRPQNTTETIDIEADQVIFAVGQKLDCNLILGETQVKTLWDTQVVGDNVTGQTSVPWIFTGGDAAMGPASVVEAVSGGEKAAYGMDLFLTGDDHAFWREDKKNTTSFDPDADADATTAEELPKIEINSRKSSFSEVELAWPEKVAVSQCKRCLRCDYGK